MSKVSKALIEVRKNNKQLDAHWNEKFFEDEDVTNDERDPHKKTKEFAKKLLGQIIFLYFLQRKGWLGVHRQANYGEGDKHFLKNIFDDRKNDYKNYLGFINRTDSFFNDVLKHIFYDALAVEHTKDRYGNSDLRFPFLNGGLFEAKFDWNEYDILLPDEVFSNDEKKGEETGTGIFDVFDRFNFTANESEPSEIEIAIDPEMLGRVFENQLLKEERGSKGTFYTPRVIVNYMCRESLLNYLFTHFDDRKLKKRPARLRNRISRAELFVSGDSRQKGYIPVEPTFQELKNFVSFADSSFDYQQGGANVDEQRMFPPSIVENAEEIDWLLQDVKICDPAIGSGAFPVGLLQEIVRLREAIAPLLDENRNVDEEFSLVYQLKLHAIQNSIYGVDIETSAVDIARLRLWLSLIVDEQQREKVRALPNLDYKIMQGNSLLEEFGGVRLIPADIFKRRPQTIETEAGEEEVFLEKLRAELFSVRQAEGNNSIKALKLKRDFEQLEKVIKNRKKDSAPKLTDENFFEQSRNQEYFAEIERVHKEFFRMKSKEDKDDLRRDLEIAILRYVNNHLNERETRLVDFKKKYLAEIADEERTIKQTLKKDIETKRLKNLRRDLQNAEDEIERLNETRIELKKLWLIDNAQNADKDLANISRKNITEAQTKPFFLWEIQFLEVFRDNGGFDIVIANPPYGAKLDYETKEVLKKRFSHIVERIPNTFIYFMGLGYEIAADKGVVTFIMPNEFLFQIYMSKARRFFLQNSRYLYAINVGEDVFEAIVPTCLVSFTKTKKGNYLIPVADLRNSKLEELETQLNTQEFVNLSSEVVKETPNNIFSFDAEKTSLITRITNSSTAFETFCEDIANGISTSCDSVYIVPAEEAESRDFEEEYVKPCLRGGQIRRYFCPDETNEVVLYVTKDFEPRKGKNILAYLKENRQLLTQKSVEKKNGLREWHILFRPRNEELFDIPKIIFRQTGDRITAVLDDIVGYYCIDSTNIAKLKSDYYSESKFFLGVLNSTLANFFYQEISQEAGRVMAQVKPQRLRALPIPDAKDWQKEIIEKFVEYILFLKKNSESPTHSPSFENKSNVKDANIYVSYFEAIIDGLVYELFLPDELGEANKEFFSVLQNETLPDLSENKDDNEIKITKLFEHLSFRDHKIRYNLNFLSDLETIRIIEGKK